MKTYLSVASHFFLYKSFLGYLASPSKKEDRAIKRDLFMTLFGRPEMAIFGAICVGSLGLSIAFFSDVMLGIALLSATIIVTINRIFHTRVENSLLNEDGINLRAVMKSGLIWSAVVGINGAAAVHSEQSVLILMTCCTITGVAFGVVLRNSAAPKFAKLQIILMLMPFIIAVYFLPIPYVHLMIGQSALWITGIFMMIDKTYAQTAELIHAQRRINYLAMNDPLTGLANRAQIMKILNQLCARPCEIDGTRSYLLFLDLDGFKKVNDSFGHGVGDELLCSVAKRLISAAQSCNAVGRFGGDEFVVIALNISCEQVQLLANRMITEISKPFKLNTIDNVVIGVSIGAALLQSGCVSKSLEEADALLYKAKHAGKGKVFINAGNSAVLN